MSAVQFVPKVEARAGDRVREAGRNLPFQHMPLVLRPDLPQGVIICEDDRERLVPLDRIEAVIRPVRF